MDARSITVQLGGRWWRGGYGAAPCPICQPHRSKGQNALTIRDKGGRLLLHCKKSGCSFPDLMDAIGIDGSDYKPPSPHEMAARNREEEAERRRKLDRCQKLWAQGQPIAGTQGEAYLRGRCLTGPFSALRFVPALLHQSGPVLPAIIARLEPTGGLNRTYLLPDGGRDKLMLGPCAGGAVRLTCGLGGLLVGEGIETTLAAYQLMGAPPANAWAALTTSGLKGLKLPRQPGELVIACDGDAPGRAAATDLAERACALGWSVKIADPGDGLDWADKLTKNEAAA